MSPRDDDVLSKIAELEVDVSGFAPILLGHKLELDQRTRGSGNDWQKPTSGSEPSHGSTPSTLQPHLDRVDPDQAMEWVLTEVTPPEKLEITGRGLKNAFGVFGAPGSGKTHLLKIMIRQILEAHGDDSKKRFGALILDPKADLIRYVVSLARDLGRSEDVRILNTQLIHDGIGAPCLPCNVIDCTLNAAELAENLVLAARSAGSAASDAFWFQEWTNLFGAVITVLRAWAEVHADEKQSTCGGEREVRSVTLRDILDVIYVQEDAGRGWPAEAKALRLARHLRERDLNPDMATEAEIAFASLNRFYNERGEQNHSGTIKAFVTKAFGAFRSPSLGCYSFPEWHSDSSLPFYEDILENGRIVLVSVSPAEPMLAKTLCTLTKCLFQRVVLSRGDLLQKKRLTNSRPVLLACDEYSVIASEVPGQPMGDGQFLALARQYGCMALLATQSVHVLEASSLRDTWRSVFSNFAAKIFMRSADNETAEEAARLGGVADWWVSSTSKTVSASGVQSGQSESLMQRENLPAMVLTHHLSVGQAALVGTLDGGSSRPTTTFLKVPFPYPPR